MVSSSFPVPNSYSSKPEPDIFGATKSNPEESALDLLLVSCQVLNEIIGLYS
jgi:hypothetical protein